MYDLLLDKERNEHLNQYGYATFDLLSEEKVLEMRGLYESDPSADKLSGFHASMFHSNREYRKAMDQGIRELFDPALDGIMDPAYKLLYANFMVKEQGAESEMKIHQDWSYVDETRADSFAIWMPLQDLHQENGAFQVLPGSHKVENLVRGPGLHCPFFEHWEYIRKQGYMKPLYLKAGEAVIWHHRLAHYSPANYRPESRIAATAIIVPKEEPVYHYYRSSADDAVEKYSVGLDFYMNYEIGGRPDETLVESFPYTFGTVEKQVLSELSEHRDSGVWSRIRKILQL